MDGASLKEVIIATQNLSGLTATFWDAPLIERQPWVRNYQSPAYQSLPDHYNGLIDVVLDRLGDLPQSSGAAMRAISSNYRSMMEILSSGHQALAHWDYRVENLFFGPNDEFAVIDWQLMMMTNPATDFAYLLSTNINTTLRRDSEDELMDLYLEGLREHGVKGYSRSDLEIDFRKALLGISAIPVVGGGSFDITNARSQTLFNAIGSRMFQTIEDWDALAMIPA